MPIFHRLALPLAFLIALFASTADRSVIKLVNPPISVRLPLARGQNQFLTVSITGDEPADVWLARDVSGASRAALSDRGGGKWEINLADDAVVTALRGATEGQFKVFARFSDGHEIATSALRYECHAAPDHLQIPAGGASVTVKQRRAGLVPGSDGYLSLQLDDITHGQTLVTLTGSDGAARIETTSMCAGQDVPFQFGGRDYVLRCERLVNFLTGDDYGEFRVLDAAEAEKQKIEAALSRIESSPLKFIRNGSEHSGKDAADHLRTKLKRAADKIKTFDQFVDEIATKSSMSGDAYLVKLEDGKTIELSAWLRSPATAPSEREPERK